MTRRTQAALGEGPGQDSFLDIVANLVGILIILIMVIGAQATDAMVSVDSSADAESLATRVDVEAARAAAESVEDDIHTLDQKIRRQQLEIAFRQNERDKFLQLVAVLEDGIQQRRGQLDEQQQRQLESARELASARDALEDLAARRRAVEEAAPSPQVIEHMPTPLAKTVFGQELHFRLLGGRLAYVPWDELVSAMKDEAPQKVWKLKDTPRITETLGPIGGFRMRYTLARTDQLAQVGGTTAYQRRVELDRFVLEPVRDDLGEPLAQALGGGSELTRRLSDRDPNRTTVTVWVYPDSFGDFRGLQSALAHRGFLTAGRPLPEGHPIGGSPDGSRSASQ